MVRILLRDCDDIDQRGYFGRTALLVASSEGHVDIVKVLIENKARINVANKVLMGAC